MSNCSCADIDKKIWHNRELDFSGSFFYAISTPMFLHLPVRIARDVQKAAQNIKAKNYKLIFPPMILCKDALFKGQILVKVENYNKDDPNIVRFTDSIFYSYVFTGPWKKLAGETIKIIITQKIGNIRNIYFWYITCPVCAKEKGEKTVILIEHGEYPIIKRR